MLIKVLKSTVFCTDETHDNYYLDLYSVDDLKVYDEFIEGDYLKAIYTKFYETLNGSKFLYRDMIDALYYDLIVADTGRSFDDWQMWESEDYSDNCLLSRLYQQKGVEVLWFDSVFDMG